MPEFALQQHGIAAYYGDQVIVFDTQTRRYSRVGVVPYGLITSHCVANDTTIACALGEREVAEKYVDRMIESWVVFGAGDQSSLEVTVARRLKNTLEAFCTAGGTEAIAMIRKCLEDT